MPDTPSVNPFVKHLFDNPWPLAILLAAAAVALMIAAKNTGRRRFLELAVVAGVLAAGVFIVERMVTTSGERAASVAESLVDAARQTNARAARALFAEDATMSLVSPANPGVGIDEIRRRLEMLEGRYRVSDASITGLDSYSVSSDRGVVHMHVWAELESGMGYPVRTSWVLRVERQGDGSWKIEQITFVQYNGRSPSMNLF